MEDETTLDRPTDEPLQVASLMIEEGKVRSMYWGYLAAILIVTLLLQVYRRRIANAPDANARRLQKLARNELIILQEASMDVSAHLFPPISSFLASIAAFCSTEATALASTEELQPLLQHIRSPPESKGSTHEQHLSRLRVLGSAMWFRFHFHAGFSKLAISTLGEALRKDNQISVSDTGEEASIGIGLPFMKETLLWALLPQHRAIFECCLNSLAWVFRSESGNSLKQSAFPMDVLTCMVDEIIQSYYLKGESGPVHHDPGLVLESPRDGEGFGGADLSTEPLLSSSSINNSTSSTGMNAQRLCGYLHLLNVFMPCNDRADQNGNDGTDTFFQLRPGILEPIKSLPDSRTSWTRPFLTKLSLLIDSEMKSNATAKDGEAAQPELTSFVLKVLPTLMIELQSYSQAIQLLQDDQSFATSRRKQLGLTAAISAYVREWKALEQCVRQGVLPAMCIAKCQVFKTMCAETLSSCSKMIRSTPFATSEGDHEEIVFVCLELATFASKEDDDAQKTIAIRLIHQARHLQLLALEALFRQVAKSIHNLAITLHVRAGIRNEKKKLVGTDPRIPSKECFDLSSELLATISGICKHQKYLICELSLEELAMAMCQSLSKTWLELQPILDRAKAPIKIGEKSLDGVYFRINRVVVQFEKAQTSAQIFASLQSKLRKLCPSEQKDQATLDFLKGEICQRASGASPCLILTRNR